MSAEAMNAPWKIGMMDGELTLSNSLDQVIRRVRGERLAFWEGVRDAVNASVQSELLICAALLMPDGYIVRGHRHDDCAIAAAAKGYQKQDISHSNQWGFMTSRNRFVDRFEALALCQAAGIPSIRPEGFQAHVGVTSEDLY